MTKKEFEIVTKYFNSIDNYGEREIYDIYNSVSKEKLEAYNKIVKECNSMSGYGFTVVNGNTYHFSVRYRYNTLDKEYLVYHTKCNKYVIEI